MDDALGPPGRARRIHPERHLVAVGVGLREIGRKSRQPCFGDDAHSARRDRRAAPLTTISVRSARILAGHRIEARAKFGIGDGDGGAGIRQIELQQVRRRQRIDQQRHEAGANRAEKRRRIGRRIVEEHQDAVAALQAQRDESRGPSGRPRRRVRHSCACRPGRSAPVRSPRPFARLSNRMRLAL